MARDSVNTSEMSNRLQRFHGCHRGERLVLVCNGPSLNHTDFTQVRHEVSIGLNKIYLGFKRFHFYPKYYTAINSRVIEQSADQIKRLNCVRFIKDLKANRFVEESALTYFIRRRPEERFFSDLREGFFEGYTVTFAALQIAYYMGFSLIVIIGLDHRYQFIGPPNEAQQMQGPDPNHFDASYFSGLTWDNPDLLNAERCYHLARQAYEADGRQIIDCTVNGHCQVFQKGRLEEVLR